MSTRLEKIQGVLEELSEGNPDVMGAAVVSEEGLIIASSLPTGIDEQRISAVVAALQSIAERAAQQITLGSVSRLILFAERGGAILCSGKRAALVILMRPNAKLGLILMDVKDATEKLKEILG